MTIEELRQLDARYRREKPRMFQLSSSDLPASELQINEVECVLGVRLPLSYRAFLREFGGGEFGLETFFSADPESGWYLPRKQSVASRNLPSGLLAFSEDGAGGYYVFKIVDAQALDSVLYWNSDGGIAVTKFNDVIEFVANTAYE